MPHLSSKFQASIFCPFKVIAFSNFVYEFVIFHRKNIRTSDTKRRGSPNKEKKKCRNGHGLFLRAERACPDASTFKTFIPLVRLVFDLELFKPPISVSVFGSETCITSPIASKIDTKNDLNVPHVSSKFQVLNLSCFKVEAFSNFVAKFVIFHRKKHRDFRDALRDLII